MKVLVIAHGHPDFQVGGAEIAAYNLHRGLKAQAQVAEATFLAWTGDDILPMGAIGLRRPGEFLWRQEMGDWFRFRTAHPEAIRTVFRDFLKRIAPDVIFLHHFVHLGIEILREIRRTLPEVRLFLTLHEYLAICHSRGQMVKAGTRRLCASESIAECHLCFPKHAQEDFWLRKHFIQKNFEAVDHFIAPSRFLKERYVDWGIPPDYITVIENAIEPLASPRAHDDGRARIHLGYFGQLSEFKGLDVLLQAMHLLRPEQRARICVEVNGANGEQHAAWYQELLDKLRQPLIAEGCLRWSGPYERSQLAGRLGGLDWVVVPSLWWENSPLVIQEAFALGVPVIAADIGGMAEKVRNGIDGLHFEACNPHALADVLRRVLAEPQLRHALASHTRRPPNLAETAAAHLGLLG